MNHADLGNFALTTLENLCDAEAQDGADEDRYVGAAFIVAYETPDGEIDVAFRTSSSNARSNIQMLHRAAYVEAATWARVAAAEARSDDATQ